MGVHVGCKTEEDTGNYLRHQPVETAYLPTGRRAGTNGTSLLKNALEDGRQKLHVG